ncbi:MAG: hypothetical protein H2069_05300 [Legionella sp.]|nr:hypothetical protein [Legionella sp.]
MRRTYESLNNELPHGPAPRRDEDAVVNDYENSIRRLNIVYKKVTKHAEEVIKILEGFLDQSTEDATNDTVPEIQHLINEIEAKKNRLTDAFAQVTSLKAELDTYGLDQERDRKFATIKGIVQQANESNEKIIDALANVANLWQQESNAIADGTANSLRANSLREVQQNNYSPQQINPNPNPNSMLTPPQNLIQSQREISTDPFAFTDRYCKQQGVNLPSRKEIPDTTKKIILTMGMIGSKTVALQDRFFKQSQDWNRLSLEVEARKNNPIILIDEHAQQLDANLQALYRRARANANRGIPPVNAEGSPLSNDEAAVEQDYVLEGASLSTPDDENNSSPSPSCL